MVNQQTVDSEAVAITEVEDDDSAGIVPEGWHVLERVEGEPSTAEGDLNQDGIPDLAAVIEQDQDQSQAEGEAAPRALVIAFGNKAHEFTRSVMAQKVMLQADEGGIWGDPFEQISINRGSVLVDHYGGSNWRWFSTHRFRYQNKDWYLIGSTNGSYFTGTTAEENADVEDTNWLTGDYVLRTTDENNKLITTTGNQGKKELIKLADYDIRE
ncbi:hypothetical protein B9T62_27915 [Paenibacillus donghaensis]|uniref:Uncharacterized protein n=1 Tax=Paenibacillus donghaensis TaxID=414771 RepID=A0A2Z2KLI2_9BACL|nr:hypothetical protein B9T62_27915 [Paenibacillus donghaensis]